MDKQTQKNLLNIVKNNYDKAAEEFSDTRNRKSRSWGALVDITKQIPNDSSVLDVGCGNGRLLEIFGNKNIDYIGTDSSDELIKIAKKLHPEKKFEIIDALELSKLSQVDFDYVFSVAVLHHLPGQDLQIKALRQIKNKVSKDGKVVITNWNLWKQKRFRKLIWKFFILKLIGKNKMDFGDILFDWKNSQGEIVSKRYYHAFTKRSLKKIAKKAGLRVEKVYKDKFNYYLVLRK